MYEFVKFMLAVWTKIPQLSHIENLGQYFCNWCKENKLRKLEHAYITLPV